jgi:hypothetical protein
VVARGGHLASDVARSRAARDKAVYAAILRSPERTAAVLTTGTSGGVGLLIGPVVYLSLAAVT